MCLCRLPVSKLIAYIKFKDSNNLSVFLQAATLLLWKIQRLILYFYKIMLKQNSIASLEPHFLSLPICTSELAVFLLFYPPSLLYHLTFTSNTKSLYPFGLTRDFFFRTMILILNMPDQRYFSFPIKRPNEIS